MNSREVRILIAGFGIGLSVGGLVSMVNGYFWSNSLANRLCQKDPVREQYLQDAQDVLEE